MSDRDRLERLLREIYYTIEYTPDQENLNEVLKRLAGLDRQLDGTLSPQAETLLEDFRSIQQEYAKPPVDERSLGRILHERGLEAYQSYRLINAQAQGYSPKDERKRVKGAIKSILDEGVRTSKD